MRSGCQVAASRRATRAKATGPATAARNRSRSPTRMAGTATTRARGARVVTKFAVFTQAELSWKTGERNTSQAAGSVGRRDAM